MSARRAIRMACLPLCSALDLCRVCSARALHLHDASVVWSFGPLRIWVSRSKAVCWCTCTPYTQIGNRGAWRLAVCGLWRDEGKEREGLLYTCVCTLLSKKEGQNVQQPQFRKALGLLKSAGCKAPEGDITRYVGGAPNPEWCAVSIIEKWIRLPPWYFAILAYFQSTSPHNITLQSWRGRSERNIRGTDGRSWLIQLIEI